MMEEYGEAVKAFTEALRLSPDNAEVLLRRGIVWYYLGESSLAMADFRQSSDIKYKDVRPYMWQGFTYAKDGDYYDAVLAYSQALEQNNRYAPAYDNRGLAYLQLGQYRKAVGDFNEVIRIQPTDARAYYKRGVAHAMQGELDQAAASYRVAVSFDPDFATAHRQLGEVYQRLGDSEAAARHRQQADQIERRPAEAASRTQPTASQRS
jgi:tetratricopeptide (TPR) repeat protein